jgi:acyl-CoA reductase-like NAD-dependent aldehyde dehydrogenase
MSFQVVNPATGQTLRSYEETPPREVRKAIAGAHEAFRGAVYPSPSARTPCTRPRASCALDRSATRC